MTSRFANLFQSSLLTAAFLAPTANAQTLDGKVVRNPDDTVTYTIDLSGPPRGTGCLYVSPIQAPKTIPLPFGSLYLDPMMIFSLGCVQLDASGKGSMSAKVKAKHTNDTPLYLQSLYVDRGILRLSKNFLFTYQATLSVGNNLEDGPNAAPELKIAIIRYPDQQKIEGSFQGQANKTVQIVIYRGGDQHDIWQCKLDKDGKAKIDWKYRDKLKWKDIVDIQYDGKSVRRFRITTK